MIFQSCTIQIFFFFSYLRIIKRTKISLNKEDILKGQTKWGEQAGDLAVPLSLREDIDLPEKVPKGVQKRLRD